MTNNKKIGIIIDSDFTFKHSPVYPHPVFPSYESPLRIQSILTYLEKKKIFDDNRIVKIEPKVIDDSIINLAHTKYYIDTIKHLSSLGGGLLNDEVFITSDTFELAKKAVGGVIQSIEQVINQKVSQSIALIRPPGHHALRENGSGLCVFNNIANSVLYLRQKLQYNKKIAIIDIDNHFGDGLVQYFYEDPSVLYFSIHEYDFVDGDIGFINELGAGEGIGKNINFPIPMNSIDADFLEFIEILEPILREFIPDLIIIAAGFDMYYADPIGNCLLTTNSYYKFTEKLLKIAEEICEGKLAFILEGGYSIIGLPVCVHSVIKALLKEKYERPPFECIDFSNNSKINEVKKIKAALKNLLSNYWTSMQKKL
ncbi:MAG: histone deacetylase [Promethearchaeota archaeon]|nr:MAG: histone deacetylase [Candidatus Lokiarchaeota archaeon]